MVATTPCAKTRRMPPPDESTSADPTGVARSLWLVIVGLGHVSLARLTGGAA